MSSRLFQSIIIQLKDTIDRNMGVMDSNGVIVACTELERVGEVNENIISSINSVNECVASFGYTYKILSFRNTRFDFAVFIEGEDEIAKTLCNFASVSLTSIKDLYDEKNDKEDFIKNIVLDNILPGDIYIKSRELGFIDNVPRVVFLVRQLQSTDIAALDVMMGLFPEKYKDFVIHINETDIMLVKEVKYGLEGREIKKIAETIENILGSELLISSVIGIGSVVFSIKDIVKSFQEARIAIEIGSIFDTEKSIISFENLGVGRLIYQLPTTLCEMFLTEIFKKGSIDSLDSETLFTIQKFFENNLNVSETSRKLFVHRNTLVYRLEKIKKLTGLDLREFDHAIVLKVALMVRKYLTSRENKRNF